MRGFLAGLTVGFLYMFLMQSLGRADVFVVTDKTGAVLSMSDAADAVVPEGATVSKVKGQASDFLNEAPAGEYKMSGKNVVLDIAKQNARAAVEADGAAKAAEYAAIEKRAMLDAYKAMVVEGKKFTFLTEKDFQ